jgi:hypothetical protein
MVGIAQLASDYTFTNQGFKNGLNPVTDPRRRPAPRHIPAERECWRACFPIKYRLPRLWLGPQIADRLVLLRFLGTIMPVHRVCSRTRNPRRPPVESSHTRWLNLKTSHLCAKWNDELPTNAWTITTSHVLSWRGQDIEHTKLPGQLSSRFGQREACWATKVLRHTLPRSNALGISHPLISTRRSTGRKSTTTGAPAAGPPRAAP